MLRILLVEDNPGDARLIRALLSEVEALRFQLAHASRLGEVEARLGEHSFDVVLLDLSLPDAHGLETVTRMHALAGELPIVVLTGGDDEALALRAVQAGAQDYLVKGQVDGRLLVRALRYAMERKRVERRFAFLSEAGRALAASLDLEATLHTVTRLVVSGFADWCIVYLQDEDGLVRRQEMAHVDAAKQELLRHLHHYPVDPARPHPVLEALRSGEAQLVVQAPGSLAATLAQNDEHLRIMQALAIHSLMVAPMIAREKTLGAIGFFRSGSERYGPDDLVLAEELARRAAIAIDNAQLYCAAQQATRARDEVLSIVSHDLGNSLSAMNLHALLLERYVAKTDTHGEISQRTQAIRSLVQQMHRLRQDLLDVSRMEAGRLSVEPFPVAVHSLCNEAMEMMNELASEKAVSLACDFQRQLPPVLADRERLLQVLSNLLGNAVKFTPSGGTVTLSAHQHDGEVHFAVTDTGPGIAPEYLAHIFDRFWQARTTRRAGAGLGLAIVKGLVEAHGGRVWVESEPGHGTSVSFALPTAPVPAG